MNSVNNQFNFFKDVKVKNSLNPGRNNKVTFVEQSFILRSSVEVDCMMSAAEDCLGYSTTSWYICTPMSKAKLDL